MQELKFVNMMEALDFVRNNGTVVIKNGPKVFDLIEGSVLSKLREDESFKQHEIYLVPEGGDPLLLDTVETVTKYFNRYSISLSSEFYFEEKSE